MASVNPKRTLLMGLGVAGCLLGLYHLLSEPQTEDRRTTEMLEARLDQEKDILLTACWRLQSLDEVIDTGGLRFLGYKRSSLEAGVNILQKSGKVENCQLISKASEPDQSTYTSVIST